MHLWVHGSIQRGCHGGMTAYNGSISVVRPTRRKRLNLNGLRIDRIIQLPLALIPVIERIEAQWAEAGRPTWHEA